MVDSKNPDHVVEIASFNKGYQKALDDLTDQFGEVSLHDRYAMAALTGIMARPITAPPQEKRYKAYEALNTADDIMAERERRRT